jgi:hypothetical protein
MRNGFHVTSTPAPDSARLSARRSSGALPLEGER